MPTKLRKICCSEGVYRKSLLAFVSFVHVYIIINVDTLSKNNSVKINNKLNNFV